MTDLILIDITDKENTQLDVESNLKSITGSGKLVVKNPSQQSRLWNMNLDLKEVVNTSTDASHSVGSLNPDQEFSVEYEIHNLKAPNLKIVEVFDTERTIPDLVNDTLLYENVNQCKLKLSVINELDSPIEDIKIGREMPKLFQNIEIKTPSKGETDLFTSDEVRYMSWHLASLGGKETATLEVELSVTPKERADVSLGGLRTTYLINNHKLTMFNPEVWGLTDSMSGVSRDEGSSPGTWDCNVEFINESEFKVRLEDVQITHKVTTGAEKVVSEQPNTVLDPDNSWDFDFKLESQNVPDLDSQIQFTPLFEVVPRIIGEINKDSTYYHVLSSEVHKSIQPPEVDAYANTNMTIENTIPNLGTSNIDAVQVNDNLPKDFVPPQMSEIKLIIQSGGSSLDIHEREEFIDKVLIEPEDQNPDVSHKIMVKTHNLGAQMPPGSKLIMTYPILAKNPKPEDKYDVPVEIMVNSPVKGRDFVITDVALPEVKIKYVKRKLKTLKSIKPGSNEGEFVVTIRIQNRGSVELENILVKENIPSGFSLAEMDKSVEYELVGTELQVKIKELKGEESMNIQFTASGSGEYPRMEPQVLVIGRGEVASPATSEVPPEGIKASKVEGVQEGKLHDLFSEIFKKLDTSMTSEKFGSMLESLRDQFPPGPVLHQILQFARDVKAKGEKIIVGSYMDEIVGKMKDFKYKYF